MSWISVKDRLPENSNVVLLRIERVGEQNTWDIGFYSSYWVCRQQFSNYICTPTHWQTLPAPPEAEVAQERRA